MALPPRARVVLAVPGGRRSAADGRAKEDFEDMRLTLQETDYGNFLANEVSHFAIEHGEVNRLPSNFPRTATA